MMYGALLPLTQAGARRLCALLVHEKAENSQEQEKRKNRGSRLCKFRASPQ